MTAIEHNYLVNVPKLLETLLNEVKAELAKLKAGK